MLKKSALLAITPILLFLNIGKIFAQDDSLLRSVGTSITNLSYPQLLLLEDKKNLNKVFIFSIAVSTGKTGKIQKITYSNQTPELDSIVSFSTITNNIKKKESAFLNYKDELVVFTVLLQMNEDWRIDNVSEFRNHFSTLYSQFQNIDRKKKIRLLPPINWLPSRHVE